MTNKIGGYGNRPVQNGTGKSVSRERDAGTSASQSAEGAKAATPVKITDPAGHVIALRPGRTWLELEPSAFAPAYR